MGRARTMRTVSLPKEEFEKQAGGLWRISIHARAGPPSPSPGSSPECGGPLAASAGMLARLSPEGPPLRPDKPRSIVGLPIISCRGRRYARWAMAVLLLDLTYSAFLLPLSIGFQVDDLAWTWACFVDLAAGACFAAELLLGFHVSYLASSGGQQREVRGGRAVARYYIRHGPFWQDLLSTAIWVTQIVLLLVHRAGGVPMHDSVSIFQLVRIVRMVRFLAVLRQLAALTVASGSSSLLPGLSIQPGLAHCLNVAYCSLVVVHFVACLWNFIAIKEGLAHTWLNPIAALVRRYSPDGASPLTAEELAAVPAAERYLIAFYFSLVTIATLGYGDIAPTTPAEWVVDCFVIALGVLIFGLAMGSLAEMVSRTSKEAQQAQLFREKMQSVNAWLHHSTIPRPLRRKIRAYYSDVWVRHAAASSNRLEQFRALPHALRREVAWEQNRRLMARLPLFKGLDESHRVALASMLLPADVAPGGELCLHGDAADRLWLLHEGEVQVFDESDAVAVIAAPAALGVEALLQHVDAACAVRPYGYRTVGACTLWVAYIEDLMPYLAEHTGVLRALCSSAQEQAEAQHEAFGWLGRCHASGALPLCLDGGGSTGSDGTVATSYGGTGGGTAATTCGGTGSGTACTTCGGTACKASCQVALSPASFTAPAGAGGGGGGNGSLPGGGALCMAGGSCAVAAEAPLKAHPEEYEQPPQPQPPREHRQEARQWAQQQHPRRRQEGPEALDRLPAWQPGMPEQHPQMQQATPQQLATLPTWQPGMPPPLLPFAQPAARTSAWSVPGAAGQPGGASVAAGMAGQLPAGGRTDACPAGCSMQAAMASRGEMAELRQEVCGRLDALREEMRGLLAAASLAHSVSTAWRRSAGGCGDGGGLVRRAGAQAKWSFGHLTVQ